MKKYLVRGGADPLVDYKPKDILSSNYIGGNSGNMLFLYGVINALTMETASCEITNRKTSWSDAEIERINAEYDAVLLPMADAFRMDYVSSLQSYTNFICKLKIPCVIIGVGLREGYEPKLKNKHPFDDAVRSFVQEVLNHSAKLGLRGEITGEYLKNLGFTPDRDFTVIGCPSLFMHGSAIDQREPAFHKIGINLNAIAGDTINDFYVHLLKTDNNIHIIQQRGVEFLDWYYGKKVDLSTFVPEFPACNIFKQFDFEKVKKEGRVHFFFNVPSWLEYTKSFGAFAGCRFHGVVAAILSGVPSAITPIDSRTREFAQFHHIPQIKKEDMAEKKSLEECFQNLDFSAFHKHHGENLANYISFLKDNGLESVFEKNLSMPFGSSPLEKKILCQSRTAVYAGYDELNALGKISRSIEYPATKSEAKMKKVLWKLLIKKQRS